MKVMNVEHICRTCLKESSEMMYSIHESLPDIGNIAEKIEQCAGIQIFFEEPLPDTICNNCCDFLKSAYKFRQLCQQSQQQLINLLCYSFSNHPIYTESEIANKVIKKSHHVCNEENKDHFALHDDELIEIDDSQMSYIQDEANENVFALSINDYNDTGVGVFESDIDANDKNEQQIELFTKEESNIQEKEEDHQLKTDIEEELNDENQKEVGLNMEVILLKNRSTKSSNGNIESYKIVSNSIKNKDEIKKEIPENRNKSGVFSCCICGNLYFEKTKLALHLKSHSKEKRHECEICHKRFAQTPQLARHMNSHTGIRPYKCQYCDSRFADPSTRVKHERIHTLERPYQCTICNKAFAYSNVLKVHIMTHTGDKPYACSICNKKFTQLHHKKAHERTHSNNLKVKQQKADK